jgi:histidine ammonia-lyase
MPKVTVIVGAFTELGPLGTLRHACKIILVKEIALISFHTQVTQPMPADNRMTTTRSHDTSCHATQATSFLHELTLPPRILGAEIRFEI